MSNRIVTLMSVVAIATGLIGCESTDSSDVKTAGIYAGIHIKSAASNTSDINVSLSVGGELSNTALELSDGDQLSATLNNSETRTLSRNKTFLGAISYQTTFSSAAATTANSTFKIALTRPADKSAPNSDVTFPAEIANFALDKTSFSRSSSPVTVTWASANTAKTVDLSVHGACIEDVEMSLPDSGFYVIPAGGILESSLEPGQSAQCETKFTLSRTNKGTVDPAYGKGGVIDATSTRSVKVTSAH